MLGTTGCSLGLSRSSPHRQWLVKGAAILFVILGLLCSVSAQYEQQSSDAAEPGTASPKKLEDTVVTEMLRIVDNKFDTLATRITSLERAVSNLQFFSIRQFRGVGGALQEVTKGMESLSGQVGKLEVDGRGLKINSRLLNREVSELKRMTSAISNKLVFSVTEVNSNIEKQGRFTRTNLQDALIKLKQDSTEELQKTLNETMLPQKKTEVNNGPINCSMDLAPLRGHFDRRLTQLKRDVYTGVSTQLRAHRSKTTAKCDEILSQYQAETLRKLQNMEVRQAVVDIDKNSSFQVPISPKKKTKYDAKKAKQSTTADVTPRRLVDIVSGQPSRPVGGPEQSQPVSRTNNSQFSSDLALQNENDIMVMEALTNMTTSVQQALSYFKNTAHILEVILSNTDMLVDAKTSKEPRTGALPFQGRERIRFLKQPFSDSSDGVQESRAFPRSRISLSRTDGVSVSEQENSNCGVSGELVKTLTGLAKNGSQLLELLTDLAQMSSVSLLRATDNLQTHVSNLGGIQSTLDATLVALSEADIGSNGKENILKISNTTDKIFKLVKTVSSNSGWLPLIFHNVKHQDAVGNRTLHFVSQNHGLLRRLVHARQRKQASTVESNSSGNRISGGSRKTFSPDSGRRGDSNEEFAFDEDSLQTIYSTSLQLHRIMPALTKLLAEPDPLFTIVEGGRPDRGRVEIYHKGQWGAICHRDISHEEADLICRHLGFQGGISAGAGHFGAGAGVSWHFNASCLSSSQCAIVSHDTTAAPCSHDRDAGVICDHMLRIVLSDPTSEIIRGTLEIHHRGLWLPVCEEGWTGFSARVACRQMGHADGRDNELKPKERLPESNGTWLSHVDCRGNELRLDLCPSHGWTKSCKDFKPAGILCV